LLGLFHRKRQGRGGGKIAEVAEHILDKFPGRAIGERQAHTFQCHGAAVTQDQVAIFFQPDDFCVSDCHGTGAIGRCNGESGTA
jgi:hypothetical protein